MSQNQNACKFPNNCAKVFRFRNVEMFRRNIVNLFRNKIASLFQSKNAKLSPKKFVQKFPEKPVLSSVRMFSGVRYAHSLTAPEDNHMGLDTSQDMDILDMAMDREVDALLGSSIYNQ